MNVYSHVLIVGGTGMLFDASRVLAHRCAHLTSVARTEHSLQRLDAAIADSGCVHHMHALDWSHPDPFIQEIADVVREVGEPDLVLVWLHHDALGPRLANALAPRRNTCAFFQVRSSAAANPVAKENSLPRKQRVPASIDYHQIILGFVIDGTGSRWLNDGEISAGVLAAIEGSKEATVVGR